MITPSATLIIDTVSSAEKRTRSRASSNCDALENTCVSAMAKIKETRTVTCWTWWPVTVLTHFQLRRTCRSSLLRVRRNDLLHQRFETRIAVQRIEQGIDLDPTDVRAVAFFQSLFEPTHGFIFIVQAEVKQ